MSQPWFIWWPWNLHDTDCDKPSYCCYYIGSYRLDFLGTPCCCFQHGVDSAGPHCGILTNFLKRFLLLFLHKRRMIKALYVEFCFSRTYELEFKFKILRLILLMPVTLNINGSIGLLCLKVAQFIFGCMFILILEALWLILRLITYSHISWADCSSLTCSFRVENVAAPFLNSVQCHVSNMYFLSFLINHEIAVKLVPNCAILFPVLICQLSLGPHAATLDVLYLSLKHKKTGRWQWPCNVFKEWNTGWCYST